MSHFPDGSLYRYSRTGHWLGQLRTRNIGWLDPRHHYPRGPVPAGFLPLLWEFCAHHQINHMRGVYHCPFCPEHRTSWLFATDATGEDCLIGHAEIEVTSPRGTIFRAPTLVAHYVEEHNYRPPQEFITAVHHTAARRAIFPTPLSLASVDRGYPAIAPES